MTGNPTQSSHKILPAKAITYCGSGGLEVVQITDYAVRPPGPHEVRILVRAAAVNPTDILLRESGQRDSSSRIIPGMDAAGTIESIGSAVVGLEIGDLVMAVVDPNRPDGGAQSSVIVVPAASVIPIPSNITIDEAATLPMNGITALRALELVDLDEGAVIAVSGGAGHLAHMVTVAARAVGLSIIADAKPSEIELVRSYGAEIVIPRGEDFCGAVLRASPKGVNAVIDTALIGENVFPAIMDGGVYIPVRGWTGPQPGRGIVVKPVLVLDSTERMDMLNLLKKYVEDGLITLRVAARHAPGQIRDAQAALQAGGVRGRAVVKFDH